MCSVIFSPSWCLQRPLDLRILKVDNYISTKVWIPSLRFPGCSHTLVFWSTPDVQPDSL